MSTGDSWILLAGHIATAVANARAHEEERRRTKALAELDRAKTTFFSNISHEFRTPLTLMLGPLEDLLSGNDAALSPAVRGQLELISRNGLRLLRLVNALLDFSRIEAGRVQIIPLPIDLAAFTTDLASLFRAAAERAGLRLAVDCPSLSEPVYVDRGMWEKIVLNLLSNAFKFTFEGEISVSLRQADQAVELRVRDTGTGIPADEMPQLFKRFHRIESSRGRTHEGSGIGLALVRELVKLHGGTITAESVVDKGTTFIVSVPLGSHHLPLKRIGDKYAPATARSADSYVEEALQWLSGNGHDTRSGPPTLPEGLLDGQLKEEESGDRPRLLIADDNPDMRQYLVRLLAGQYAIEAVADGAAALAAVRERKPDLVLTDIMMPRLDGLGLLQELRADPGTQDLPVIMLSARAGEESRVEGMEAGADDYLVKPFSARELRARVGAHLQMARLRREASQSLRESEERLRMALAAARMVAWQWDLADDRVTTSENAATVLGLPPETTIEASQQGFALIHPDDVGRYQATLRRAVRKRGSYLNQFRLVRPDNGQILWLEEQGHCVCEAPGEVTRLVGVVRDITRRKQAEFLQTGQRHVLEMIVADKLLPDVLTALIQAIEAQDPGLLCSVLLLDDDGRHIRSGAGPSLPEEYLRALGGLSIEPPYIGPCGMAMHCQQEVVVPDTESDPRWPPQWRELALRHGLRSCRSMPILASSGKVLGTFANYRRQPNGREPASMQLLQIAAHLAGIAIERQQARAALQESRIQLASELAAMTRLHELVTRLLVCPDLRTALDEVLEAAIAILGAEMGTVQLFDPRSKTLEIVAQKGFQEGFLDRFRIIKIDEETAYGRTIRSGERVIIEDIQTDALFEPYRQAAAAAGYRAVQSTPLLGRNREPLGVFSTHYRQPHCPSEHDLRLLDLYVRQAADFIERIRGEEALRQADRRKDEFLATLAHELRNPLAPLRTGLEVMRMAGDNQALTEEVRTMMEGQIRQLVRLLDDLLDISRITRGKIMLRKEPMELAHAMQSAMEATRPLMEKSGHELTVMLPPQPIFLHADPVRLTQIFSNLLTNAARYTPDGGRIWLSAEQQGSDVLITIKDTGIGLPADRLESIFEMFTQVDQSLEVRHAGLGIGLTLVKQLVTMHGGSVEARSEGLGQGSELIVRLPIQTGQVQERQQRDDRNVVPSSKLRILVVDDNQDAVRMLSTVVEILGHEVCIAYDGLEAVEKAAKFRPDMVLMDLGMPKLNGCEAARRIREQPWGQSMALIALTGWGQAEDRRRTKEAGFNHHLVKPVEPEALQKVLADYQPDL